jgi:hypothetical protein
VIVFPFPWLIVIAAAGGRPFGHSWESLQGHVSQDGTAPPTTAMGGAAVPRVVMFEPTTVYVCLCMSVLVCVCIYILKEMMMTLLSLVLNALKGHS